MGFHLYFVSLALVVNIVFHRRYLLAAPRRYHTARGQLNVGSMPAYTWVRSKSNPAPATVGCTGIGIITVSHHFSSTRNVIPFPKTGHFSIIFSVERCPQTETPLSCALSEYRDTTERWNLGHPPERRYYTLFPSKRPRSDWTYSTFTVRRFWEE